MPLSFSSAGGSEARVRVSAHAQNSRCFMIVRAYGNSRGAATGGASQVRARLLRLFLLQLDVVAVLGVEVLGPLLLVQRVRQLQRVALDLDDTHRGRALRA